MWAVWKVKKGKQGNLWQGDKGIVIWLLGAQGWGWGLKSLIFPYLFSRVLATIVAHKIQYKKGQHLFWNPQKRVEGIIVESSTCNFNSHFLELSNADLPTQWKGRKIHPAVKKAEDQLGLSIARLSEWCYGWEIRNRSRCYVSAVACPKCQKGARETFLFKLLQTTLEATDNSSFHLTVTHEILSFMWNKWKSWERDKSNLF